VSSTDSAARRTHDTSSRHENALNVQPRESRLAESVAPMELRVRLLRLLWLTPLLLSLLTLLSLTLRALLGAGPLLVQLLADLLGHLQVLPGRLECLGERLAKLWRRILLEDLQRVGHFDVGHRRAVDEGLVEIGAFVAAQLFAHAGDVLLTELLLQFRDVRGLPATGLSGPEAGRALPLRGFGLRRFRLRLGLLLPGLRRSRLSLPGLRRLALGLFSSSSRRASLAELTALLSGGTLQFLHELLVVLDHLLCEFLDLLRLGAFLRELRQGDLTLVVSDEPFGDELIVHFAGLSASARLLSGREVGFAFPRLPGLRPGLAGLAGLAGLSLLLGGVGPCLFLSGSRTVLLSEDRGRGEGGAHGRRADDAAANGTHNQTPSWDPHPSG
jgi:hypothetical protein